MSNYYQGLRQTNATHWCRSVLLSYLSNLWDLSLCFTGFLSHFMNLSTCGIGWLTCSWRLGPWYAAVLSSGWWRGFHIADETLEIFSCLCKIVYTILLLLSRSPAAFVDAVFPTCIISLLLFIEGLFRCSRTSYSIQTVTGRIIEKLALWGNFVLFYFQNPINFFFLKFPKAIFVPFFLWDCGEAEVQ